jgi:hypothetical protein
MDFENGLPKKGQAVEIRTVWNDDWSPCVFQGQVSDRFPEKGHYDWFGVYAKPDPSDGSLPIVTEWRVVKKAD